MGFSARDFVMNYLVNVEEDGTFILVCSSQGVNHHVDPVHGITRADCPISGIMLVPNKDDPNKTYAYVVNEVDLKTSLPGFLIRQAFKDQGLQIERIRHVLPKWKKLFPGERPTAN